MGGWRKCAAEAVQLVCSWWQADRIRPSPREGRLLRIEPEACLRIGATMYQVKRRTEGRSTAGPHLTYECESAGGRGFLRVTPTVAGAVAVCWIRDDTERVLSEDDVEVF